MIYGILGVIGFIILISIKQVDQYERGILFTFGKFTMVLKPGWKLVFPIIQCHRELIVKAGRMI